MPKLRTIGYAAFSGCTNLSDITFDEVTIIQGAAFSGCAGLSSAVFPALSYISYNGFYNCTRLKDLYLLGSSMVSIYGRDAFGNTPMSNSAYLGEFGSIHVPASLYESYLSYGAWSWFSSRFVSIEEEV